MSLPFDLHFAESVLSDRTMTVSSLGHNNLCDTDGHAPPSTAIVIRGAMRTFLWQHLVCIKACNQFTGSGKHIGKPGGRPLFLLNKISSNPRVTKMRRRI
jgi:hypothetical protein